MPQQGTENLIQEESLLNQSADNLLGASELRSGRETPNDPRAPAAKTALLLNQSSVRLDDFIFQYIMKENEVLDLILKLYYQFGPEKLQFVSDEGGELVQKNIERSKLNSDTLHLKLSVTSLIDNPDFLKARWEDFYAKYSAEPMLGAIPPVRWNMLNQIIDNMPEARGKGILPPLEQATQAAQQQAQAQAQAEAEGTAKKNGGQQKGAPPKPPINPTLLKSLTGGNR